jgi:hypothetical protein
MYFNSVTASSEPPRCCRLPYDGFCWLSCDRSQAFHTPILRSFLGPAHWQVGTGIALLAMWRGTASHVMRNPMLLTKTD